MRKDKGKTHQSPEGELHAASVKWARELDLLVVGSAIGVKYANGAKTAAGLLKRGCDPGTADLLILAQGVDGSLGLAVEFKIWPNTLSDKQVAWLARARARGWRTEVVYTFDAFQRVVREHLHGVGAGSAADPVLLEEEE